MRFLGVQPSKRFSHAVQCWVLVLTLSIISLSVYTDSPVMCALYCINRNIPWLCMGNYGLCKRSPNHGALKARFARGRRAEYRITNVSRRFPRVHSHGKDHACNVKRCVKTKKYFSAHTEANQKYAITVFCTVKCSETQHCRVYNPDRIQNHASSGCSVQTSENGHTLHM